MGIRCFLFHDVRSYCCFQCFLVLFSVNLIYLLTKYCSAHIKDSIMNENLYFHSGKTVSTASIRTWRGSGGTYKIMLRKDFLKEVYNLNICENEQTTTLFKVMENLEKAQSERKIICWGRSKKDMIYREYILFAMMRRSYFHGRINRHFRNGDPFCLCTAMLLKFSNQFDFISNSCIPTGKHFRHSHGIDVQFALKIGRGVSKLIVSEILKKRTRNHFSLKFSSSSSDHISFLTCQPVYPYSATSFSKTKNSYNVFGAQQYYISPNGKNGLAINKNNKMDVALRFEDALRHTVSKQSRTKDLLSGLYLIWRQRRKAEQKEYRQQIEELPTSFLAPRRIGKSLKFRNSIANSTIGVGNMHTIEKLPFFQFGDAGRSNGNKISTLAFRARAYRLAYEIIQSAGISIYGMVQCISLLREGGLIFRGEEKHFLANNSFKSSVLQKIYTIFQDGVNGIIQQQKQERRAEVIRELSSVRGIGREKATTLFDKLNIESYEELCRQLELIFPSSHNDEENEGMIVDTCKNNLIQPQQPKKIKLCKQSVSHSNYSDEGWVCADKKMTCFSKINTKQEHCMIGRDQNSQYEVTKPENFYEIQSTEGKKQGLEILESLFPTEYERECIVRLDQFGSAMNNDEFVEWETELLNIQGRISKMFSKQLDVSYPVKKDVKRKFHMSKNNRLCAGNLGLDADCGLSDIYEHDKEVSKIAFAAPRLVACGRDFFNELEEDSLRLRSLKIIISMQPSYVIKDNFFGMSFKECLPLNLQLQIEQLNSSPSQHESMWVANQWKQISNAYKTTKYQILETVIGALKARGFVKKILRNTHKKESTKTEDKVYTVGRVPWRPESLRLVEISLSSPKTFPFVCFANRISPTSYKNMQEKLRTRLNAQLTPSGVKFYKNSSKGKKENLNNLTHIDHEIKSVGAECEHNTCDPNAEIQGSPRDFINGIGKRKFDTWVNESTHKNACKTSIGTGNIQCRFAARNNDVMLRDISHDKKSLQWIFTQDDILKFLHI